MGSHFENYPYVDGYYENPQTRHSTPWVRVLARDLERAVCAPATHVNCYASIQRFKDATSNRDKGRKSKPPGPIIGDPDEPDKLPDQQMHYHGLFFDFDCKAERNNLTEEEALERSRKDASRLADFFLSRFGISEPHVQAWFSGRKGFHVTVRPECFDIRPHRHLTYIMQKAALELIHQLDLVTLDRSVYTLPRMWRIPNTIHADTGRYKTELTVRELRNFSIPAIVELSRKARADEKDITGLPLSHIYPANEYENIIAEPAAISWWTDFCGLYETIREMKNNIPRKLIVVPTDSAEYPACMRDMLDHGCKPGGPGRNRSLIPMVAFLKDAGTEKDEARRIIRDWTNTHFGNDDTDAGRQRLANGRSVVDSVYRGDIYSFSCRSILSNSGPTADARVACVGQEKCAWIGKPEDQESAELPLLHLSEASKGCYLDKKVRLPVHVSGIAGNPFGLPIKGEANCTPDSSADICQPCPMLVHKGRMIWSFGADDRETLKLIDVNDPRRRSTIKEKLGIPIKCFKHKLTTIEKSNVEELQIIPMVDYSQVYMEDLSGSSETDVTRKAARHVVRRAFHLGHGVVSNKKYIIEASVFEHPEDQRIVYLFDKMEPAQNDIDQFEMTPELLQQLRLFQPREGQSVEEKFAEIHNDFEANVHHIGGRQDLAIGFDLCYHSVISFKFIGDNLAKGWFELVVLGDSGTGKTTMIQRMMKHYGLGELIAGEESKRTGLVYASVQMSGQWFVQWGKIPQNDRRLLVIDEFHSIPPEEVGKMTQLRSSGLAQCGGVNSAYETFARTRMILLANSRSGRALSEFNYGIEAVRDLYDAVEDCRRVDMALVARADDVPKSIRNRRWDNSDVRHVYTADLCSKLVLWAWSRDPQHVEWAEGAEDEVIRHANILADTYECDIPIAQPSDLREKIARISAAVAARLFSTDADARKLYIKKEHVAFAANYMDTAYRKPAMAYFEYARMYKNQNNMTAERRAAVRAFLLKQEEADNLIAMLGTTGYLTKNELGDMTSYDKDDLTKVWKFLVSNQLIRKTARGYRKTPAFTELLKGIGSKRSGYSTSAAAPPPITTPSPRMNGSSYHAPPSPSVSEDLVEAGDDPPY